MRRHLLAVLALALSVCIGTRSFAGTTPAGFVDEWLVLHAYHASDLHNDAAPGSGANPGPAWFAADYLCDGETSESNIVPEVGLRLAAPVTDAGDCPGNVNPAAAVAADPLLLGFDELAMPLDLDTGELEIVSALTAGDLLNFNALTGNADDCMAYAWVYVNNLTGESINTTVEIGSDDSIVVGINRATVLTVGAGRGAGGPGTIQNSAPATLVPGGNLVQVKLWDGCCGWGFRLRFNDIENCRPLVHEEGVLEFGITPIEFSSAPGVRTIDTTGAAPGEVVANIAVDVANGGQPYDIVETFDEGWTPSNITGGGVAAAGSISWTNMSAGAVTYRLTRSDGWVARQGSVSGETVLGGTTFSVGGDSQISGGLTEYVPEVLITPALEIAGDGAVNVGLHGCNMTPVEIEGPHIVGEDLDTGDEVNDANIVPYEGMSIALDYDTSLASGINIGMSLAAETRFGLDPVVIDDQQRDVNLVRVTNTRADGLFDVQAGSIYGGDIQDSFCVAYFYAINDSAEPRDVIVGFGSDDAGGVRVNGHQAHTVIACRGHPGYGDKFIATLDPGKNLFMVTAYENGGGYNFCVRFEDENFRPIAIPTTLDPNGYDPAAHDDPGDRPGFSIDEVLLTASLQVDWSGCINGDISNLMGDHITNADGTITDQNIIPDEGLVLAPDFGGNAPRVTGIDDQMNPDQLANLFNGDLAEGTFELARVTGSGGFYNVQRADIFGADVNNTMCIAYTYVINEEDQGRCVILAVGTDDSARVLVNGRDAHFNGVCRGDPGFADKVRVWLDPGKNLVALYTYENGSGYNFRWRFENDTGGPLTLPVTLDPTGYDPADHGEPPEDCRLDASAPSLATYMREGPAMGMVTKYLIPALPLDQGLGAGGLAGAFPEDYASQDGGPPDPDQIFEGAEIAAGTTGNITTGIRGAEACGVTQLVLWDGAERNPGDPSGMNGEAFYGNPDNYSSSLFVHIENLTDDDLEVFFGFASDDSATLFLNGVNIMEHVGGRGWGGANTIQNFAQDAVLLEPGDNLVQLSYNEGGGGSGARLGLWPNACRDRPFTEEQITVTPSGIDFEGAGGGVSATRSLPGVDCEANAEVIITFQVADGGPANVDLEEVLPDGVDGENPSMGTINGGVLSFVGDVNDGDTLTYSLIAASVGDSFCGSTANGLPVGGDTALGEGRDVCDWDGELYINCGGPETEDSLGRIWLGDAPGAPSKHLVTGDVHTATFNIGFNPMDLTSDEFIRDDLQLDETNPTDQSLLLIERWDDADINYRFTSLPNGTYEVALLFMEACCSEGCASEVADPCDATAFEDAGPPAADPMAAANSSGNCRVFDVHINGEMRLDQFSQSAAAACIAGVAPGTSARFIAVSRIFEVEVTDGTIDIVIDDLGGGGNPQNAAIKGICIRESGDCANNAPTASIDADPGFEVSFPAGGSTTVTLSGAGSDDGDGGAQGLSFSWTKVSGPDSANIVSPSAESTAVELSEFGDYTFRLTVNDGENCSSRATADVTISTREGEAGLGFLRGDTDGNGQILLNDSIKIFAWLFQGGTEPTCVAAADASKQGQVNLTSGIYVLNFLFTGGGTPPAPFPASAKSSDPGDLALGCVEEHCP